MTSFKKRLQQIATVASLALAMAIVSTIQPLIAGDDSSQAPEQANLAGIAPLAPLAEHPRTSINIVEQLRRNHYLSKPIDDALSSAMLDKYLDILDGNKSYFLASDIQEFEPLRFRLDDALKASDLDPAFHIFNRYQDRLLQRLDYSLALLQQGLETFDFAAEEALNIDREQAAWPADTKALDELWRQRLKSQILSLRLNDKDPDEIVDTLTKRLRNQMKMLKRNKSEDAFQVYMNSFASTYDPHTQYFSPRTSENFNINMSLSLEGIGAVLKTEDDVTSIVRLVPAGPAAKSGAIKPTDKITAVGQGSNGPMIDIIGWRLDDVVELIRGPKGSTVQLQVVGADADKESSKRIAIVRNTIKLEEQAAQAKIIEVNAPATLGLTRVSAQSSTTPMRVGVIEIPTFYIDFRAQQQGDKNFRSTTRDVRKLIEQLRDEGIEGLIIDLRSNGGGSLQEADSMTGLFVGSGPTVQVKAARQRPNIYSSDIEQIAWDGPMAVMVNRLSASASEIFAGAIQDYGRGIVIGSRTFGKGTVQTLIPLNRGQLKLTAAKFYRVSGESTQNQGVTPDITFPTLVDDEQIGESTLDDAMPWDMIKPAVFTPVNQLSPSIKILQQRHTQRAANDPHFDYYRSLMARSEIKAQKTSVSLNEKVRRSEKTADDDWRLALENQLRVATNKTPAKDLDELEDLVEAESASEDADVASDTPTAEAEVPAVESTQAQESIAIVEDDPLLQEAGNIVADLVRLQVNKPNATDFADGDYSTLPSGVAGVPAGT